MAINALVVLLVVAGLLFIVFIVFLVQKWYQARAKDLRAKLVKERILNGLNMNWSKLLNADGVDGLSLMPEDWKNAIVPKRSEAGRNLDDHLQYVSMQIQIISARRCYCSTRPRQRALSALKTSLREFIEKKVAPFFASRNQMYHDALLRNNDVSADIKQQPSLSDTSANANDRISDTATTAAVDSRGDRRSKETVAQVDEAPATRAASQRDGSATEVTPAPPPRDTAAAGPPDADLGELPPTVPSSAISWPENSSNLYRQIIQLLWYLDNLFKSSYDQIFTNQVSNLGLQDWDDWAVNVNDLIPDGVVLSQNTSQLFELYRQASEVHSYYDAFFSRLARETNAEWHPAGLKKIFRILEKAELLHYGDFDCSKIFDIVRGTLVYDTMHGVLRGVRALFSSECFDVARIKDRFSNPTSAHWRDVLVNGRMVFTNGKVDTHIVEIQFHQRDLREERQKVGGHFIYERHRALFEACELTFGDHTGEKLHDLHHGTPTALHARSLQDALIPQRFTKRTSQTSLESPIELVPMTSHPKE